LAANVRGNDLAQVRPIECAVTDSDGVTPFYEAPASHFGMGSIAPQFHANPTTVTARRLDSVLDELRIECVGVLKVDVEGYEWSVFKGAQRTLAGAAPPLIVFEFCDWAEDRAGIGSGKSQGLLREWGYSIWKLDEYIRGGAPSQAIARDGFETLVAARP
jgi:FkbM family methyltransferase